MYFIFLFVSFCASIIGAICGIGGGVIIKPVLDAIGVMEVSTISFLSGCTVLSMSVVSIFRALTQGGAAIEFKRGTPLAIGAAIGGILGKEIFQAAMRFIPDLNKVGAIQAVILCVITIAALVYTINASKIKTHNIYNSFISVAIGLVLGLTSVFLGIGGGPINIIVLTFFFSMETKQAAINSVYIIMISQLASLVSILITQSIPEFEIGVLILMAFGGITGALVGSKINKKITSNDVKRLFVGLLVAMIFINIYNIVKFSS